MSKIFDTHFARLLFFVIIGLVFSVAYYAWMLKSVFWQIQLAGLTIDQVIWIRLATAWLVPSLLLFGFAIVLGLWRTDGSLSEKLVTGLVAATLPRAGGYLYIFYVCVFGRGCFL